MEAKKVSQIWYFFRNLIHKVVMYSYNGKAYNFGFKAILPLASMALKK